MTQDPSKNVKAAEDFLKLILYAYIISVGETLLSNSPSPVELQALPEAIVASFVTLRHSMQSQPQGISTPPDGVVLYAKEVLTLGLIWLGFYDAIQEGDGIRVMRYWKVLLLLFKATNRNNYSIEAMRLLLQQMYLVSPRKAAQLTWSRFINTQGRQGRNMPADLHMEHLNRTLKTALTALHSNITDKAIDRIGRSVGIMQHVSKAFLHELHVKEDKGSHNPPSFSRDLATVTNCLREERVFTYTSSRRYDTFTHTQGILQRVNIPKVTTWLRDKYHDL